MNKKQKIWLGVLIIIMLMDIILHFTTYTESSFGSHINYIASILMAFTIGIEITATPWFRG